MRDKSETVYFSLESLHLKSMLKIIMTKTLRWILLQVIRAKMKINSKLYYFNPHFKCYVSTNMCIHPYISTYLHTNIQFKHICMHTYTCLLVCSIYVQFKQIKRFTHTHSINYPCFLSRFSQPSLQRRNGFYSLKFRLGLFSTTGSSSILFLLTVSLIFTIIFTSKFYAFFSQQD